MKRKILHSFHIFTLVVGVVGVLLTAALPADSQIEKKIFKSSFEADHSECRFIKSRFNHVMPLNTKADNIETRSNLVSAKKKRFSSFIIMMMLDKRKEIFC